MDAMERRCQIVEILCDAKMRIKMRDLASRFNVSIRTIRTEVDVLSLTYPIQTTRGRYNGGIGFIDLLLCQQNHLPGEGSKKV